MKQCDLIITADSIITQNEKRDILRNAGVAVSNGIIAALAPLDELEKNYTALTRLDLGRALLLPGLINAHTHTPMTLLRGMADDLPLMEWLTEHIFPLEAKLSPHMLEVGAMLACAEMLRTGTTVCVDMYMNERHICKVLDACGMKALVGEGIFSVSSLEYAQPERIYEKVRADAAEFKNHPRLRYAVMPHSVYTTNRAILEKSVALAEELDLPLHMHLAETRSETAQSLERYGCRPVEVCRQSGLLGPRTLIAHGVELLDDEIALLAEKGVILAHCPRSNMKLASGAAPVPRMLAKGMNVALGTDGAASNNMLNMFQEMNSAALLHKAVSLDPTVMPAQTVLDMATINGGKAIGWPELGSLKPGGPADLTALDCNAPNLAQAASSASQLVYSATGHEVILTMVDGRILYDNGTFKTIDYQALLKEAQDICSWLMQRE